MHFISRLKIIADSLSPSHTEVKRRSINKTLRGDSGLTLPYHRAVHVGSVLSCHVINSHMPHVVANDVTYVSKMYCKVKFQRTCVEYKNSCNVEK